MKFFCTHFYLQTHIYHNTIGQILFFIELCQGIDLSIPLLSSNLVWTFKMLICWEPEWPLSSDKWEERWHLLMKRPLALVPGAQWLPLSQCHTSHITASSHAVGSLHYNNNTWHLRCTVSRVRTRTGSAQSGRWAEVTRSGQLGVSAGSHTVTTGHGGSECAPDPYSGRGLGRQSVTCHFWETQCI